MTPFKSFIWFSIGFSSQYQTHKFNIIIIIIIIIHNHHKYVLSTIQPSFTLIIIQTHLKDWAKKMTEKKKELIISLGLSYN